MYVLAFFPVGNARTHHKYVLAFPQSGACVQHAHTLVPHTRHLALVQQRQSRLERRLVMLEARESVGDAGGLRCAVDTRDQGGGDAGGEGWREGSAVVLVGMGGALAKFNGMEGRLVRGLGANGHLEPGLVGQGKVCVCVCVRVCVCVCACVRVCVQILS